MGFLRSRMFSRNDTYLITVWVDVEIRVDWAQWAMLGAVSLRNRYKMTCLCTLYLGMVFNIARKGLRHNLSSFAKMFNLLETKHTLHPRGEYN